MATATLPQPVVAPAEVAPATPLSATQQDTLILLAAAHEKPAKVRAGTGIQQARAWSMGGNVD